jgi:ribosomal protein S27AE
MARPKGSRNVKAPVLAATPVACPRCGSTESEKVSGAENRVLAREGTAPSGQPYTHIVWKRRRCCNCGQQHTEKSFELRKEG